MLHRKHPKQIRAERKIAKQKLEYAEKNMFDSLAENIAIEIDKEIIDRIRDVQKKNAS